MSNNLAKDGSNHLAILPSLVMWCLLKKVRTHFQENPADDF